MEQMKNEKSNNTGAILAAGLIGAVVGGALGILFAPAKGSDTRKNILAKGEELKDAIGEKIGGIMDSLSHEETVLKEKVEEFAKNGSTKV
jgi:gas vesicle protein